MRKIEKDLSKIKVLILDVDGVLSDGSITMTDTGMEIKHFCVKDGSGLKYFMRVGGRVAIITGRESEIVQNRADELGLERVFQNCKNKLPAFETVLEEFGVTADEVAVMGDDLPDLPMLLRCGFSACPADAVDEVQSRVDYVCRTPGGKGCVRELVEVIIKSAGKWDEIMSRYLDGVES